jgi:hypothetical protein
MDISLGCVFSKKKKTLDLSTSNNKNFINDNKIMNIEDLNIKNNYKNNYNYNYNNNDKENNINYSNLNLNISNENNLSSM